VGEKALNTAYRFTYMQQRSGRRPTRSADSAARPQAPPRRPWIKLAAKRTAAPAAHGLSPLARLGVTSFLVVVSLAAVGQQSRLYDAVAGRLNRILGSLTGPGEDSAAAIAKPPQTAAPEAPFEPLALLADGHIFALAKDGRIAVQAPGQGTQGQVIVTGPRVTEVPEKGGIRLHTDADLDLLRRLLALPLAAEMSEIHLGKEGPVVVYLRDATKIIAEAQPDLEAACGRLERVRQDLRSRQIVPAAIDLRYQGQVVVRPRK
jgi:hypothetical protein